MGGGGWVGSVEGLLVISDARQKPDQSQELFRTVLPALLPTRASNSQVSLCKRRDGISRSPLCPDGGFP